MLGHGLPLELPPESGAEVLWTAPFRADWATDPDGAIRRPEPLFVETPFEPFPEAEYLHARREVYPITHFCLSVPDALVVGERAIVTRGYTHLITDTLHWNHSSRIFMEDHRCEFEFTHLRFREGEFHITLGEQYRVDHDEAVLISSMEQNNYGAFLLRCVPKLATRRLLGLEGLPVFVSDQQGWQRAILRAFGIGPEQIISYDRSRLHHFRRLLVPDLPSSEFFLDDMTSDFLDEFVAGLQASDPKRGTRPEKIYVSRMQQTRLKPHYRPFVNEPELAALLEAQGFAIIEPENFDFEEQVRIFAAARVVVGPGGAGMFNTIFCRPGTNIVALEPLPTWMVQHANLYVGREHGFAMVLGGSDATDPSAQKRWRTDAGLVARRVREL